MFKTFKTDKQKKHIVIAKVDDVTLNGLLEAMFRKKHCYFQYLLPSTFKRVHLFLSQEGHCLGIIETFTPS